MFMNRSRLATIRTVFEPRLSCCRHIEVCVLGFCDVTPYWSCLSAVSAWAGQLATGVIYLMSR